MRVEIEIKFGNKERATAIKEIDLGELYDNYWTSEARELALQRES